VPSEIVLAFQFGYGANSTEFGRSPGTISAIDAGFPGLIRGTVTNIRCLITVKYEFEPLMLSLGGPKPEEKVKSLKLFTYTIGINTL